ncbi:MAG: tail fiber domain-containing protein [Syntrophaceae bacterium]|nr:tail fiber domain-containing protein [Syntrophaceae bacterium]
MRKTVVIFSLWVLLLTMFAGHVSATDNITYSSEEWSAGGSYNTFIGGGVGLNNTGSYNTFMGFYAGGANATGNYNTFVGGASGLMNTTGSNNTFIGFKTGSRNTTGNSNAFLGYATGINNSSGAHNTFFGYAAGNKNTTGSYNTYLGNYSGLANTTGQRNTIMGYTAGQNNAGSGNVFIGYAAGANETGSNKLYIANSNTSTPLIWGDFGTGVVKVNGAIVQTSSQEYKDNIKELKTEDAIQTLQGLHPVTYTYKTNPGDQQVGFIAEDVPELVATQDRKGMSSMDVVAVLTKVVQEQQRTIAGLQTELNELKGKIK